MISKEILRKVRKIEIVTRRLVNDIFAGEYHSLFKGRGMEFSEVREYSPGDDVRTIDWNVSARMGTLYVKKYVEERELTVMLVIDMSSSGVFGTAGSLKSEIAAELSALLAFSAIKNNDKVGLLIFTDRVEKYIPPKKGKAHILCIIREIITFRPIHNRTDMTPPLDYLNRILKRRSIVFIISDFISPDYSRALSITNQKHDAIAVSLVDPREKEMDDSGFLFLEDAETGEETVVQTDSPLFRKRFALLSEKEYGARKKLFQSMSLDHIEIRTDRPYVGSLERFFKARMKRCR